jgi:hypothetical protein
MLQVRTSWSFNPPSESSRPEDTVSRNRLVLRMSYNQLINEVLTSPAGEMIVVMGSYDW